MLTLGIETSCDETAVAVVRDGRHVLSNTVHSQIPIHAQYGGVVPELASRNHVLAILPVLEQSLETAGVGLDDVDVIAVTRGPGLVGALMVGLETAKALAFVQDLPLVGVNHIEGHILSPFVDPRCLDLDFPYVALVVSGGHTALYLARSLGVYELLGATLDDAAGEALDKVAKRLGAGYPGGPFVEREARLGQPTRFPMPAPMLGRGLDFSFSGLKTAAATQIGRLERSEPGRGWVADCCAGVQDAVVRVLVSKLVDAVRQTSVKRAVLAGGVACNGPLRRAAESATRECGARLFVPAPSLCTDNGAMIAAVGALRWAARPGSRGFSAFTLEACAALTV